MAKARLTLLHIVRSLLFVLLVPLQFVSSLPSRHLQFHRWTGRLILVLGVVLGVSALLLSVRPDGVAVEGMATIWFGCFLLVCLGRAWWHLSAAGAWKPIGSGSVTRMVAIALDVSPGRGRS